MIPNRFARSLPSFIVPLVLVLAPAFAAAIPRGLPTAPDDPLYLMRDPFSRPRSAAKDEVPKTEIELIPIERFKLLGVSTGPKQPKAMLQAEGGKTYFVTENLKIGTAGGVIRKILPTKILISEKTLNELGQEQSVDREIALPDERASGRR